MENKSGQFVAPTPESGAAALASVELPENLRVWPVDPAAPEAYPITTFTWLLLYKKYDDAAKLKALKDFITYGLTEGQSLATGLGYIPLPESVVMQLDKSHITVHTYPEYDPKESISTFRADIDVSTCGEISPLKALNYLIHSFEADIMTIDYRVRGFTRDINGHKLFIDHDISSIQNYIPDEVIEKYQMIDVNVYPEHIFHTKCKLKQFDLNNYLFGYTKDELSAEEQKQITEMLVTEMDEIFYGKNIR